MLEVGTIVSVISTDKPFNGIVVTYGFDRDVHINPNLKTPPYGELAIWRRLQIGVDMNVPIKTIRHDDPIKWFVGRND